VSGGDSTVSARNLTSVSSFTSASFALYVAFRAVGCSLLMYGSHVQLFRYVSISLGSLK
jgi:hypothetical protein